MNIDAYYWVWVVREINRENTLAYNVNCDYWINGVLFTLILDRMRDFGVDISPVNRSFNSLFKVLNDENILIDLEIKQALEEGNFSKDFRDRLEEISDFKKLHVSMDCFVDSLECVYEPNYYVLLETSNELVKNIRDIFYEEYTNRESYIALLNNIKAAVISVNKEFKNKILDMQFEYFANNINSKVTPTNLGYMLYCMEFMNRFANNVLTFEVASRIDYEDVDFPSYMYQYLLDWENNIEDLIKEFNELEKEEYEGWLSL
ncbi:hypothetical protein [Romboutsia sp.]|uniref:hypothetical protein n=1 Tax=Romboutsia sp. TaxID=1965302 RepID=UPI003F3CA1E8